MKQPSECIQDSHRAEGYGRELGEDMCPLELQMDASCYISEHPKWL